MKAKMDKLQARLDQQTTPSARTKVSPPDSAPKGSQPPSKKRKARKAEPSSDEGEDADVEPEPSQEAKLQRLRRLCEVKGSGKCHVTPEIHSQWKRGGADRDKLLEALVLSNYKKEWQGWNTLLFHPVQSFDQNFD